ncbi:MAG: ABC transporter substrate-binding protein [Alphaproteobacteria bacterium]
MRIAANSLMLALSAFALCPMASAQINVDARGLTPDLRIPILAPITGPLSLEGNSQKNGALLALTVGGQGLKLSHEILDTAMAPETGIQAFEKAMRAKNVFAISAPIFGNSMLAIMPLAKDARVPLLTISGTAQITEAGNPYVFRFFPSDEVLKAAQARYVVEDLKKKKIALVWQNSAYGQSGRAHLTERFKTLGAEIVFEDSLPLNAREMLPTLTKVVQSGADALVLQLHSGPTALIVKQAAAMALNMPIVAGSAMHQPSTAALLEPRELKGVCAETNAAPIADTAESMRKFVAAYRKSFNEAPDGFAAAQFDAVGMALFLARKNMVTREALRDGLATSAYQGIAMNYKSDGKGNMAHDAIIICYDGTGRVPTIAKRYADPAGTK